MKINIWKKLKCSDCCRGWEQFYDSYLWILWSWIIIEQRILHLHLISLNKQINTSGVFSHILYKFPSTYKNSVARLTRSVPRRKNNEAQLSKIITNIHIHYHQIFISDCYLGVILHEFNISAERNCFLKGFCYFFPEFWFSLLTKRYAPGEPCYSIFVCGI